MNDLPLSASCDLSHLQTYLQGGKDEERLSGGSLEEVMKLFELTAEELEAIYLKDSP